MRESRRLGIDRVSSPLGTILLVFDGQGDLRALDFEDHEARMQRLLHRRYGTNVLMKTESAPGAVTDALGAFFAGHLNAIVDVVVRNSGTEFQRRVWLALRAIPAGTTLTYGQLAAAIERPQASRAVGLANGANPVGIIVPCHRVIGADGTLTGYGGGLERKRWLLAHEQRWSNGTSRISA
jgi:methylated-DNA-[protein]-cysteine S-methyltransferase